MPQEIITKQDALSFIGQLKAKIKELREELEVKVSEATKSVQEEVIKLRRERIEWFYAGYGAGMSDDPTVLNPAGKSFTLEQRKTKAAAAYAITQNNQNQINKP